MLSLISQIDITGSWIPSIASIVAFLAILTITWNMSRKITTLELSIAQMKLQTEKDLSLVEKKHLEDVKALETEIHRQTGERKDDMLNEAMARKDALAELQVSLTNIRSQLKDVDNRVTIVDTVVKGHTMALKAIHRRIKETQDFFTTWIQRVEDRVEKGQDRAVQMVRDSIREVMGNISMMINLRKTTR